MQQINDDKQLSVIIPVYNERDTIRQIIDSILSVDTIEKEIIIVDDYSNDGTRDLLEREIESMVSKVIYHETNQGKGAAIRTALKHVTGEYTIIQDADLEYNPKEYPVLLEPMVKGKADVVFGSRFMTTEHRRVLYFWHYVGNKFITLLSNMLTNLNISDVETCYKLFRTDIIKQIKIEENRFGFEPEITAKAAKIPNIRIYEVGISYHGRTYAEGKKINWKDGFRAIWCIFKYNLFS